MKLVAKNDRVIIKPLEKSVETINGIIIPDQGKEKPEMGEIISVGPGKYAEGSGVWIPTTLTVGEKVLVPKFGASQIDFDGEEYYITREIEVIAGLEEEPKEVDWNDEFFEPLREEFIRDLNKRFEEDSLEEFDIDPSDEDKDWTMKQTNS